MNKILLSLTAVFFSLSLCGQIKKVKGNLITTDTADLTILNVFPDSFPNISVVFKAETRKGEPVWNLTKEKMMVKENSQDCNVISLEQISKNKPINLGIVIDHSGSMSQDMSQLYDKNGKVLFSFDSNLQQVFPKGYTAPIDNAKYAVKKFVSSFDVHKDFISVIGFSNIVDKKLALTQDISIINATVDSMQANFSTALYDAMIQGIDAIKKADGVKVLVALTDGNDNSSTSAWKDVVAKANKEDIPVYIIGLGDVNKETLQQIAQLTKGHFYFTQSSSSLNTVYAEISKQVQAFYNIVYNSPNFSAVDVTRQIEVSFDVDSISLETNPATLNLPQEVVSYLQQKERRRDFLLYGGIATVILISIGTLLFYYKRKGKDKPLINSLFPNPTNGSINLDFVSGSGQLQIISITGKVVKNIPINGSEKQFNLADLQDGNYIAVIQSNGQQSNPVKFIIDR